MDSPRVIVDVLYDDLPKDDAVNLVSSTAWGTEEAASLSDSSWSYVHYLYNFVIGHNLCAQRGTEYVAIGHYSSEPTVLHVRGSPGERQPQSVPAEADHCSVLSLYLVSRKRE